MDISVHILYRTLKDTGFSPTLMPSYPRFEIICYFSYQDFLLFCYFDNLIKIFCCSVSLVTWPTFSVVLLLW